MAKIPKITATDFKNKKEQFSNDAILNMKADNAKKDMLSRTESDALTKKIMSATKSKKSGDFTNG